MRLESEGGPHGVSDVIQETGMRRKPDSFVKE